MKYIITIGREYGSGGRFIGQKLAEKLGIKFYDQDLINKAAEESGLSMAVFKNFDEKRDSIFASTTSMYSYDISLGQRVFLAQFDTIKKIAEESDSCVIVGRCADYVLRDNPNLVSVFICAPVEDKIERAIKYYGVNPAKAPNIIIKMDKKRKSYYNFYTDREWGKARTYDICINSKIGIDESVNAIVAYIKGKFGEQDK